MIKLHDIINTMNVQEIDTNLFTGQALDLGLPRVFGGQVLGQSLNAAARTIDQARQPHSLHGYFLRPGDITRPIIYLSLIHI